MTWFDPARRCVARGAAAAALAALLAACASAPPERVTAFPRIPPPAAGTEAAVLTASADGRLIVENGCLRLRHESGVSSLVIWPDGAAVEHDERGPLVRWGGQTVRPGDRLRLSTGWIERYPGWMQDMPAPEICPGPYMSAGDFRRR